MSLNVKKLLGIDNFTDAFLWTIFFFLIYIFFPPVIASEGYIDVGASDANFYLVDSYEEDKYLHCKGQVEKEIENKELLNTSVLPEVVTGKHKPCNSHSQIVLYRDRPKINIFLTASHEYYHYKFDKPGVDVGDDHSYMRANGLYLPMPWNIHGVSFEVLPHIII